MPRNKTREQQCHETPILAINFSDSRLVRRAGGARRPKKNKPSGGLTKWFKEEWVDVKTGKPCGRKSAKKGESKRPYPSCRPKAVADKMTKAEKASSARRKTGPSKIKHAVTASGRRRKNTRNA